MSNKNAYVVGTNVRKSLSPLIFNHWFKKYNIKGSYNYKEIQESSFEKEIELILKEKNLCGLNITTPFKEKIIPHLNHVDKHAEKIGAVNYVIKEKNYFKGANTDWTGFQKTINNTRNKIIKKDTAIVLGYGGAAKAIIYSLIIEGYKKIKIFNRTFNKIKHIEDRKKLFSYDLEELPKHIYSTDLIVNTIPADVLNALKIQSFEKEIVVFDVVYRPKETTFLKHFNQQENKIYGIFMLIHQAIPCFYGWFGTKPEIDAGLVAKLEERIE